MEILNKDITSIKGVGDKKAQKLNNMSIFNIEDLFYNFPRTYEDRRKAKKIVDAENGTKVYLEVTITSRPISTWGKNRKSITKIDVRDDSGYARLVWFNNKFAAKDLFIGKKIKLFGLVKRDYGKVEIHSPEIATETNDMGIGTILPVYNLTKNLTNKEMNKILKVAFDQYLNKVEEFIPEDIKKDYDLMNLKDSLLNMHYPKGREQFIRAKYRQVFEELLLLQTALFYAKESYSDEKRGVLHEEKISIEEIESKLPFNFTNAQKRVCDEIFKDMESIRPMNRLLQGDVGSGKTLVAMTAMLKAFKNGYQSVMMAPTEILAVQHFEAVKELLEPYGIRCELMVGSIKKKKKQDIIDRVQLGLIDIVVGTHALIQGTMEYKNLGLAITDEQHRFGVRQRNMLKQDGRNIDVLVMSATPIPRTLGLILYGDLDISIIDEMPKGRKQIQTKVCYKEERAEVYEFVQKEVEKGRQCYVVCPLIEESEKLSLKSAEEVYEELSGELLRNLRVGLLHGKMTPKEKDFIMNDFKEHKLDILVSTTVIEVGVNVPNSSVMVIENSERFGLAQLHQLRGRVGRGEYQSYCMLITEGKSEKSKERMKIMESSTDGFLISEKDLELRGPGDFFGTRQHGIVELKIAEIFKHMHVLKEVQPIAEKLVKEMERDDTNKKLKERVESRFLNKLIEISLN